MILNVTIYGDNKTDIRYIRKIIKYVQIYLFCYFFGGSHEDNISKP